MLHFGCQDACMHLVHLHSVHVLGFLLCTLAAQLTSLGLPLAASYRRSRLMHCYAVQGLLYNFCEGLWKRLVAAGSSTLPARPTVIETG